MLQLATYNTNKNHFKLNKNSSKKRKKHINKHDIDQR